MWILKFFVTIIFFDFLLIIIWGLLLCKINMIDIFNTVDFMKIFVLTRNTEILIDIYRKFVFM